MVDTADVGGDSFLSNTEALEIELMNIEDTFITAVDTEAIKIPHLSPWA
jgi:hypothetical protein